MLNTTITVPAGGLTAIVYGGVGKIEPNGRGSWRASVFIGGGGAQFVELRDDTPAGLVIDYETPADAVQALYTAQTTEGRAKASAALTAPVRIVGG